jgi:hypothetical protein
VIVPHHLQFTTATRPTTLAIAVVEIARMNVAPMDALLLVMELAGRLKAPKSRSNSFLKSYSYIQLRLTIM